MTDDAKINWAKPYYPGRTCMNCRHWVREDSADSYLVDTPQGKQWVPQELVRDQVSKTGNIAALAKLPAAKVGPCSFHPQWSVQAEHHWCHQWRAQDIEGTVN